MTAMFSSPKKPDTSKQEALIAEQENQIKQDKLDADRKRKESAAATRSRSSGMAGLISGSELGVTPVGRTSIG